MKGVQNAGILMRAGESLKAAIKLVRILLGESPNGTNAEKVKIFFDGRADRNEVPKLA
jgi:hypothetical protein